jgi:rhamnose transport system ATP-binding protein
VVLGVEGLSRTGYFKDFPSTCGAAEIVGLTGLVGAGRTEVVQTLSAWSAIDSEGFSRGGKQVSIRKPQDAQRLWHRFFSRRTVSSRA